MKFRMEVKDLETMEYIKSFVQVGKTEIDILIKFIRENIDPSIKICYNCPSQSRLAFQRFFKWMDLHKEGIDSLYLLRDEVIPPIKKDDKVKTTLNENGDKKIVKKTIKKTIKKKK